VTRKVPGALWVPKWAGAPELIAAFRRGRLQRGKRWEDSPSWIARELGLGRKTVQRAMKKLPRAGLDAGFLAPIHGALLPVKLSVRARLLATHVWRRGSPDRTPGAYRPTLRDLAEDFSWSRSVVDRAVAQLRAAGVLVDEVIYVQGSKKQVLRHVDVTAISEELLTVPRERWITYSEWVKPGPVIGSDRGRQLGQTGAGDWVKPGPVPGGTSRHQPPPTVPGVYTEGGPGAEERAEKGRPARAGRGSPGVSDAAPGAARFAFALPPLPNGMPVGAHADPIWTRCLLRETREGLEAGPPGSALAWLLEQLGVARGYRLGHQLAREGFGVRQVLEHVKRVHARAAVRNRAAVLGTELRDLLQGFR